MYVLPILLEKNTAFNPRLLSILLNNITPPPQTRGNYKHIFDGFALLYVIKISHIITWS